MHSISDIRIDRLDAEALRRLIAVGEAGGVERKASVPNDGLGPSIAAFANSGGSWLLLGVSNDGAICGFSVPGRSEPQDWLREVLRQAIDPLPDFRSALVRTRDGECLVIHIPQSTARPHVIRNTGVLYEREPGGKRPVDSQAKILEMSRSSEETEKFAIARLTEPALVRGALAERMTGPVANDQTKVADWFVAATPMQVPPSFANWALTKPAVRSTEVSAADALRHLTKQTSHLDSRSTPRGRGFVIRGTSATTKDELALTIDAGASAVARWSTRLFRGVQHLPAIADDVLLPLIRVATAPLASGGSDGCILVHLILLVTPTDHSYEPEITVWAGDSTGSIPAPPSDPIFLGGRIGSPDDGDLIAQADAWMRELGRSAGIDMWEPT